jgi:hypothetical protein
LAVLVGMGSLLLPVPETVEVAKFEAPPPVAPPKPQPAPKDREARRPKPPPKPEPPKPFPMQDTTKTRQMIPPKK